MTTRDMSSSDNQQYLQDQRVYSEIKIDGVTEKVYIRHATIPQDMPPECIFPESDFPSRMFISEATNRRIDDDTQLAMFENASTPNNVDMKQEESPTDRYANGSFGVFNLLGYTPDPDPEHQPDTEIGLNTPKRFRYTSRLQKVFNSRGQGCFGDTMDQYECETEPLESPVYAKIFADDGNQPSKRRAVKIPQALPLQKVSRRKISQLDQAEWDLDEHDEEVIILMDGILTKVGKPSGPISSGKILSTVQNCPITVKWLLENFESMVGQSLPRSFVYDQYVSHCGLNKIDSVNAASFGKLIRSVFLGLRTRRLGTRGNSKYHYYGIKIKESSHLLPILNSIRAEQDLLNDTVNGRIRKRVRRTQSVYTGKHVKGLVIDKKVEIQENLGPLEYQYPTITIERGQALPTGIDETSVSVFEEIYKRHCMKLVEFFHGFKLIDVLSEIANFWRLSLSFKRKNLEDYSGLLPKPLLFKITTLEVVETFIIRMDLYTYQHIINILIPTVLRPLPLQMLQAVDNMIQDILGIFTIALNGFPKRTAHGKLQALTAFIRIWKQYSKMSQLSEFVELTLENESTVAIMRYHFDSINLEHLCDRSSLIIESNSMTSGMILKIMTSFSGALQSEQALELWCEWAHDQLLAVARTAADKSIGAVEHVTTELQSFWLILSNLIVNAIREMFGFEASFFVHMLQWCGELMQYFRQRLLDNMKQVMPITRFHMALEDEDMSISFLDKYRDRPLATVEPIHVQVEEEAFPMPLFIPTSVRLLDTAAVKRTDS